MSLRNHADLFKLFIILCLQVVQNSVPNLKSFGPTFYIVLQALPKFGEIDHNLRNHIFDDII